MTLEERMLILENRMDMLEQNQAPYIPNPLYPWHEKKVDIGDFPPMPTTWCCSRNTHHDGETK
jgi:hypothetical protein